MPINNLVGVDGIPSEATRAPHCGRAAALESDEAQGGGDLAAADQLLAVLFTGVVAELATDHQRGRATAVEVDRLGGAEPDHRRRQLGQVEAGLGVGAALADDRDQLAAAEAKGGAGIAA